MVIDLTKNIFGSENTELSDLSVMLREKCASLSTLLHPVTADTIKKIIAITNAYYSCKAKGHEIHPLEIENAFSEDFSRQKSKKLVQLEAKAYHETEIEIKKRMLNEQSINICSLEFISWIHFQLFEKLPYEFKRIRGENGKLIYLIPGEIRKEDMRNHLNGFPKAKQLRKLLIRFEEMFNPAKFTLADSPAALAEAHAVLTLIHPFPIGNAMMVKLFTKAYFILIGLSGCELFSLERTISNKKYDSAISESQKDLKHFRNREIFTIDDSLILHCKLFLQTILDEADFMYRMLSQGNIIQKFSSYLNSLISEEKIREESKLVLKTVFLAGELRRGEVLQIIGRPERTARRILGELFQQNLLKSDTPKGPVRINFLIDSAKEIFSELF